MAWMQLFRVNSVDWLSEWTVWLTNVQKITSHSHMWFVKLQICLKFVCSFLEKQWALFVVWVYKLQTAWNCWGNQEIRRVKYTSCRSIFVPEMSVKVFSTKSVACFLFHHNFNQTRAAITHNSAASFASLLILRCSSRSLIVFLTGNRQVYW